MKFLLIKWNFTTIGISLNLFIIGFYLLFYTDLYIFAFAIGIIILVVVFLSWSSPAQEVITGHFW